MSNVPPFEKPKIDFGSEKVAKIDLPSVQELGAHARISVDNSFVSSEGAPTLPKIDVPIGSSSRNGFVGP